MPPTTPPLEFDHQPGAEEPGGPDRPWTTTDMDVRDARLPPDACGAEKEEEVDKAHYWEGG